MKPKLQLGGEKEGGNTSARSSAQTMQQLLMMCTLLGQPRHTSPPIWITKSL